MDAQKGQETKKRFRFSLRAKMNLLIAAGILITSTCLLLVSYRTHCRQTDELYLEEARHAAYSMSSLLYPKEVDWFRREIDTDDFRDVRERAAAAGDPAVIEDWLKSRPGFYREESPTETLLDDYQNICQVIEIVREGFPLTRLYIEEERDNGFYVLADPERGLLRIGAEDPDIGSGDEGESGTQPDESGWLCYTYEFITMPTEKENIEKIIAYAFADINMKHMVELRHRFLYNSVALIILLTAAAIVIGMLVVRRIAVKPLRMLQRGAMSFAKKRAGIPQAAFIPWTT